MFPRLLRLSLFFFAAAPGLAAAKVVVDWDGNIYKKVYAYKRLHKKFSKQVCSPGADSKYKKYLRAYRGSGHYLPLVKGHIDRKAIGKNLSKLKEKTAFIAQTKKRLEKLDELPDFDALSKPLEESLRKLLNYKKEFSRTKGGQTNDKEKIAGLREKSNRELDHLRKRFDAFVDSVFFLKSFNFPNDHLANRRRYELYKDGGGEMSRRRANNVFFMRKIVEDGTYDSERGGSDLFLRSTLDTLYLAVQEEKGFVSENLRHDLEWTLKKTQKALKSGKEELLGRLEEWLERTELKLEFYSDIIKAKNKKKARMLVKEKNEASIRLKKYVYAKQAEVYKWWMDQSELMKALFVLETILFNEVGRVDGKDALERADVAQIVLNRVEDPFYSSLDPKQQLVKHLGLPPEKYSKQKWLNTLFRAGEFSFTYHYIPSVEKIFCPDMSSPGRSLRSKNVKISLQALKNHKEDFNVLRYFSRISMLGKIDMSSVWFDYKKYPERPGYEIADQRRLTRLFLGGKYRYLYSFEDPKGVTYQVVEIGDKTYSVGREKGKPRFHKYRNPHLFKYFIKK